MLATAKHFPGHGDTGTDSHIALPVIASNWARLDSVELVPFRAAIAAGVKVVMSAHIALPGIDRGQVRPGTVVPEVLTGILRDSLRFDGLVVTDALTMSGVAAAYGAEAGVRAFLAGATDPRASRFAPARVFWGLPEENTLDRMTATLPELLYRRTEELGLDFVMLYPSMGLTILGLPDEEVRRTATRALNLYYAEAYAGTRDRLEPVAVIPLFDPQEAIEELEHAAGLGLRAFVTSGAVPPNSATVRLYQAPMPSPRSSVGNSSLMIAGAIDVSAVYRPSPTQNTITRFARPGLTSVDSGTTSSAIAPDHTSICGLRP